MVVAMRIKWLDTVREGRREEKAAQEGHDRLGTRHLDGNLAVVPDQRRPLCCDETVSALGCSLQVESTATLRERQDQ